MQYFAIAREKFYNRGKLHCMAHSWQLFLGQALAATCNYEQVASFSQFPDVCSATLLPGSFSMSPE